MTQRWGNEPFSSHSLPGSDSSEEQLCSKGLTCNKTNVVTQHKGIYMRVTQTPLENSTEKKPPNNNSKTPPGFYYSSRTP